MTTSEFRTSCGELAPFTKGNMSYAYNQLGSIIWNLGISRMPMSIVTSAYYIDIGAKTIHSHIVRQILEE